MFNLFALAKDDVGAINNESLIRDLQRKLSSAVAYRIYTEDLHLPKTTIVVMERNGWRASFDIRPGEHMVLLPSHLKKSLGKNASKLPANFMDYNCEIAFGFDDDPEQIHTDDIIEIGEFVRENYPGVVIYDQYNKDLW